MPHATLFIRPDVTLDAAVPATISHPRLHNLTNAVLVTVNATDLGRADVRVGQGRDVNVTLGTETTVAGVGNTTTLRGGDAVGVGPSAGGDIIVQPGAGAGGGATGSFRPLTTGTYTSGTATLAWGTEFARTLRPDNDQSLTIRTVQVGAGAGQPVNIFPSAAAGGGPAVGGDIIMRPGAGVGGGARGVIRLDDAAAALSVLPTTTNLVTIGGATLGLVGVFARALRSDDNQALAISTVQVAAGAGPDISVTASAGVTAGAGGNVTVIAGAGVGAGANLGGSITLTTGAGSGAASGSIVLTTSPTAARGVIRLDDQAAALSVLPTTTNLVTIGSATLAIATTFTRIVQADTGQALLIRREDGATWTQLVAGGSTEVLIQTRVTDGVFLTFGNSDDARLVWATANANNALVLSTGVGVAAQSGNIILTTTANIANEHGLAAVATPRLTIFSAADMSVPGNRTQYVQMYHDGIQAILLSGGGAFRINAATDAVVQAAGTDLYIISGANGTVTAHNFAQRASSTGTPTGVVFAGAPHTTLANAALVDWNVNLARTVQFAGSAGADIIPTAYGVRIQRPAYQTAGAGALTITEAATLTISAAPQVVAGGGGTTITNAWALLVEAGNIGPLTTNASALGSATRAFSTTFTRELRADTGNELVIRRGDGTEWARILNAGAATINFQTTFLDIRPIAFGNGSDVQIQWSTASANNALHVATGVGAAAQSGNIILTTLANFANEHGLAAVATPRLAIFSAADMAVPGNRTQYVQMYHDGTNAVFVVGNSNLYNFTLGRLAVIDGTSAATGLGFATEGSVGMYRPGASQIGLSAGNATTLVLNGLLTGVAAATFTQPVNTSGTPTGLLFTAAAHTTLAATVESIDINWNLARVVQFATGAIATQRAFVVQAPTYAFVAASTLTTTATLVVTACPTAGTNATFTNPICVQFGGAVTVGPTSAGLAYRVLDIPAHTVTVTGATAVTSTVGAAAVQLGIITLSDAAAVTVDAAATLYIAGPPAGGGLGPVTITNAYAVWVDAGNVRIDAQILGGLGTAANPTYSFNGDPDTGMFSSGANLIDFSTAALVESRLRIDTEAGVGNTGLLVSVAGAAPIRVSVGAADSAGAGFRTVRVPN